MFHQIQQFPEHPARFETTLSLELRQAQLKNASASAMLNRERHIFLRHGNDAQEALRQQRTHMVHEQRHFVEEGEDQTNFVRHQIASEQRASSRIFESVSQDRDFHRQEAQNVHDIRRRSESTAELTRKEVQSFIRQWCEVRGSQ